MFAQLKVFLILPIFFAMQTNYGNAGRYVYAGSDKRERGLLNAKHIRWNISCAFVNTVNIFDL